MSISNTEQNSDMMMMTMTMMMMMMMKMTKTTIRKASLGNVQQVSSFCWKDLRISDSIGDQKQQSNNGIDRI